ncbi:MAG: DUF2878 domain-containing protein [Rhodanobacter sp.]
MTFWLSLIGYQLVWFAAVIGAAHGLAWPGMVGLLIYASVQLVLARNLRVDLSLAATAIVLGFLLDGGLIRTGLATYAAPWPSPAFAPTWILALWAAFAMTFTQSLAWLQTRLWLAVLMGLIGGPLAYLGAARAWHVVVFAPPIWRGLLFLGVGWALATPLLAWMARRGTTAIPATRTALRERRS